jgi:hypothetical protein
LKALCRYEFGQGHLPGALMGIGKRAWGGGEIDAGNEVTANLLSKKFNLMLLCFEKSYPFGNNFFFAVQK